jgi:hypothetical protein
MKKLVSFLFVLTILAIACGAPLPTAVQNPVIENTPLSSQSVQFTSIPTLTSKIQPSPQPTSQPTIQPTAQPTVQTVIQPTAGFPTFTPPTALPGQPNQIRFSANGTYTDVTDSIVKGVSKTYSLNAMKGQVMSVSILPQAGATGTISMQIKGKDGSILCPLSADDQCLFWRGRLPASQDYSITLTSDWDIQQFVMRVAINPPGKEFQYFQFNSSTGISLTYPDTFAPALPAQGNYKTDPMLTLRFIDSKAYDKTNLSEVYLMVSSTSDAQTVATCTAPNQNGGGGPEHPAGNEIINGLTFVHTSAEGAGAGNYYQQEIYRTVHSNTCTEVVYFIHYTNASNYTPGTITEFDSDSIVKNLYGVFSTVVIK